MYQPPPAEDVVSSFPGQQEPPAALQPPGMFRPGDFKWRLAERAIGFLRALAATGADGCGWTAAAAPALRALLAANISLRSMLG